jgi:hypothetical protein
MKQVAFTIALAGLMMDGSAWGADLLCPPGEGGILETLFALSGNRKPVRVDQWEPYTSYRGLLEEVEVITSYNTAARATNSTIICRRLTGSMMMNTTKTCRLIGGNGTIKIVLSGKSKEMTTCTFDPPEKDNNHACMVVCEP